MAGSFRISAIKKIIKDFRPDVVHTHAAKAGAVGRMAAHELGVKAVVHTFHGHVFHSYFGPVRTSVFKGVERYLSHRTSRIIAISEKQKSELVDEHRICSADKVSVIPLGFDLSNSERAKPKNAPCSAGYMVWPTTRSRSGSWAAWCR